MIQLRTSRKIVRQALALAFLCAALGLSGQGRAQPAPAAQAAVPADTDEQRIGDLIDANHILANEGVLDGFGHVSVRSVKNPRHYFMARSRGPGLVTRGDIMEFDENSEPVDQQGRAMYSERFIHGEIFRARPDVVAVVHSHSPEVMPFTVTKAPFQALAHISGFLGTTPVPVFEIRDVLGAENQMLVRDSKTGAAVAKTLGQRSVVLMRGHGMAVVAPSVRMVTLRAIYTQLNARIEAEALRMGTPTFLNATEASRIDPTDRPWEVWLADANRAAGRAPAP
jgi:ribulose-5-phosphate 4-epimerase/fuculose-1-phosphate aldolase